MKIIKALTALLLMISGTAVAKDKSHAYLEIDGMDIGRVSIVRGPSIETEVIEYQDGDDILLKNSAGKSRFGKIVVSRKMKGEKKLLGWYLKSLSGEADKRGGALIVCNKKGDVVDRYDFEGAWPTRWEGGIKETVTLAVDSIAINFPADEPESQNPDENLSPQQDEPIIVEQEPIEPTEENVLTEPSFKPDPQEPNEEEQLEPVEQEDVPEEIIDPETEDSMTESAIK